MPDSADPNQPLHDRLGSSASATDELASLRRLLQAELSALETRLGEHQIGTEAALRALSGSATGLADAKQQLSHDIASAGTALRAELRVALTHADAVHIRTDTSLREIQESTTALLGASPQLRADIAATKETLRADVQAVNQSLRSLPGSLNRFQRYLDAKMNAHIERTRIYIVLLFAGNTLVFACLFLFYLSQ